jgi:cytochrome P450
MHSLENISYPPASESAAKLVAVSITIALVYWTYQSLRGHQTRKRFERELGCKPMRRAPQKDPFFALDIFVRLGKAAHERKYLQTIQRLFLEIAPTFGVSLMGDDMLFTNEPENVRTMLVSKFKSFDHGERIRQNSHQFMGVGVVIADGKAWERGRSLIKPNFYKKQVADLQTFEHHFQVLRRAIPTDYTPIEMQQWFFRFVSRRLSPSIVSMKLTVARHWM